MLNAFKKNTLHSLFLSGDMIAQEAKDSLKVSVLKGQVMNSETKKALESLPHILNLNSVEGTITNDMGNFEIMRANDTVIVSYLGYSSIKIKITNDLLKGNELLIALYEKSEEVKEIIIKSTKLIGVLEVDVSKSPKINLPE